MTRIGSLFSGAGGLDLAAQNVFGGDIAWHCENDPAASKVKTPADCIHRALGGIEDEQEDHRS